jgi:hypothetical protein
MTKSKQETPEIIYFAAEDIDLFMLAVRNVSIRTYISNNSIFKKNDREIEIYDTRAAFLINVGVEYQKLINKRKENEKET